MKTLFGLVLFAALAFAQNPPAGAIRINTTQVQNGIVGDCLTVSGNGRLGQQVCGGGGGGGTVTSVTITGTAADISATGGCTSTTTISCTIDLINTAVTPNTYTNANITVDQKGRITAATSGTAVPSLPLSLANGGTHADLSGTGGTSQVLKQTSTGANISVARLACADLSDAGSGCTGSSGGAPGGSNTQLQYNNSSAFGGITGATTNGTVVTLTNSIVGTQSQNDNSTKAASTAYTDLAVANGLASSNPATSAKVCSAAVLPAVTYANGASGIGATLTQNSAAVLVVDGYTVVLGDRILVKNQASTLQNGIYTVGTLGTGIIPFVLVRALDFDQPNDINNTGPIGCQTGTAGAPGGFPTTWLLTTTVTAVGTDAITFTQASFGGNTVIAVSPGVGIAHFPGSTQTATSSAVNLAGGANEVTNVLPGANGGGLVLIEQHTASTSAALNFTTCISATYDEYQIEFLNLLPTTGDAQAVFQVSTDGGSTYVTGSNYSYEDWAFTSGAATGAGGSSSATSILLSGASTVASVGQSGSYKFYAPGGANFKALIGEAISISSTQKLKVTSGGIYESSTAVNAFRILESAGNISTGTARCYGIAKT